jgi:hypothetical protein
VHYGLGAPPESLREDAQILLRQTMVRRLRILAPLIFFPTLLSGIAVAILEGARGRPMGERRGPGGAAGVDRPADRTNCPGK